jgi:hypothetical protein
MVTSGKKTLLSETNDKNLDPVKTVKKTNLLVKFQSEADVPGFNKGGRTLRSTPARLQREESGSPYVFVNTTNSLLDEMKKTPPKLPRSRTSKI